MAETDVQRSFVLGDSWLYYKIYSGPQTSDMILTEVIKPLSESLLKEHSIDKWFYIRYADPEHHIRVRFHYNNPDTIASIANQLLPFFKDLVDKNLVWKIQTDTYVRELERYGSTTIELAEELFFHDSEMIVKFLSLIEGDEGEELRWLFSFKAIDSFLDSFGYTDKGKLDVLQHLKTAFAAEFGMHKSFRKQIKEKHRENRQKINDFMTLMEDEKSEYAEIVAVINTKNANTKSMVERMLKLKKEGRLELSLDRLMESYIHMLMNRLFKSKNRLHEMVCYDFLHRYYVSSMARNKV